MIIDGKQLSQEILAELTEKRKNFEKISFAVIVVGNISAQLGFIKAKENFAKKLDIDFRVYELPENLSRSDIRKKISQIVKARTTNGAIIQLPLPLKFFTQTQYFLNAIISEKDVDCLSAQNIGKFFTGEVAYPEANRRVNPPAVEVVDFIKEKFKLNFSGKTSAIVGYGNLIGKPITHYLLKQGATCFVINSKTDLKIKEKILQDADIIVSGVGKKNLITDCKQGAIIIDFGYSVDVSLSVEVSQRRTNVGDIDFEKLKNKASLITPTPGGTGPILVAMLYKNLLKLAA